MASQLASFHRAQKQTSHSSLSINQIFLQYNKSSADQACLGQDGWTLTLSFFCLYTDRNFVLVHKYAKKESLYPAIILSFEHTSPLCLFLLLNLKFEN